MCYYIFFYPLLFSAGVFVNWNWVTDWIYFDLQLTFFTIFKNFFSHDFLILIQNLILVKKVITIKFGKILLHLNFFNFLAYVLIISEENLFSCEGKRTYPRLQIFIFIYQAAFLMKLSRKIFHCKFLIGI